MSSEEKEIEVSAMERELIVSALNRIDAPEPDVELEWEKLRAATRSRKPAWSTVWRVALSVAACGVLLFAAVGVYFSGKSHEGGQQLAKTTEQPEQVYTPNADGTVVEIDKPTTVAKKIKAALSNDIIELKTPVGQDLRAELSDGTKVWLNSGSSLRLYKYFSRSERRVQLSGEAYFDVVHNADRPFIVETDYFTVTDIGTSFNVKAYGKSDASVALVSGKVAVKTGDNPMELLPGQLAEVRNGEISVHSIDIYPFTQRKDGLFYFHDASLKDIMAEIGRWYGRNVVFESPENMEQRLHFVDERSKSLADIANDLNDIDGVQVFVGKDDIVVR